MTLAGARGETAAQMREALCISPLDEMQHVAFADIVERLNAAGDGDSTMMVTNSLWGQEGAPLQPGFLDLIARQYRGAMNLVDFSGGADAARITINRWVGDKTQQKIRELIPSGALDANTCLVLVNAIYFKGIWALKFRKAVTRDEPFHLEGGGTVQAPLMYQQEKVLYLKAGGYQAVDLAYRGGALSMLVLLPDRKDGLRDLEKTLSARMLHDCVKQMRTRLIELFLPRFKITWGTVDLREQLIALGMPLAFTPLEANFSGINSCEPPQKDSLFISAVFHKTFVETNEEGTEAAAATGVSMTIGSRLEPPPLPIFRADHPFLFAICDRYSGAILFLGRIADPARLS
jgi:serpin B